MQVLGSAKDAAPDAVRNAAPDPAPDPAPDAEAQSDDSDTDEGDAELSGEQGDAELSCEQDGDNRLESFLNDPELSMKIFFSSYFREKGLAW